MTVATHGLCGVLAPLPELYPSDLRGSCVFLRVRDGSALYSYKRETLTMRWLIGTQPLPEIQAAQYDKALKGHVRRVLRRLNVEYSRRYVVSYTLLRNLSWHFRIRNLFVGDVNVLSPDVVL